MERKLLINEEGSELMNMSNSEGENQLNLRMMIQDVLQLNECVQKLKKFANKKKKFYNLLKIYKKNSFFFFQFMGIKFS